MVEIQPFLVKKKRLKDNIFMREAYLYLRSHVFGNLTVAVSTGSLSMDNSLGDSLTGEVSKFVEEMEILGKDGAAGSGSH